MRTVFVVLFFAILAVALWNTSKVPSTPIVAGHSQNETQQELQKLEVVNFIIATAHPVTTNSTAAQFYFNQGLTLVYAFNHDEAYKSFKKAAEIDPKMAMAYWGMALSLGSNINMTIIPENEKIAYETIQKALALSDKVTENERDYITALSHRYSNDPNRDLNQLARQYSQAMRHLSRKYPEDLDAAVLFAESAMDLNPWRQWSADGEPLEGTLEVVDTLESVLKRDPNHLGANHYYIHAVEASRHPERALMSAERLSKLLPQSGHILHMPSHIYILVGDYHKASQANEEAVVVDRAYVRQYGMGGIYPLHYLSHNLYFLSRSYSMEGRFEDAISASGQLQAFYSPHYQQMPELEYYEPTKMFVLLRFHRWKELLDLPQPDLEKKMSNVLWHFGRALAYASLGKQENAKAERKKFLYAKDKISPDSIYGYNKADAITPIAENMLASKMAEMDGNLDEAVTFLRKGVAFQDVLHYNEPPDWFFSIRESLGGALYRAKRYQEAEQVFREDLDKHPRNGRSLFGLLESLKAQSKQTEADWVDRQFKAAWQYSDTPLHISDLNP